MANGESGVNFHNAKVLVVGVLLSGLAHVIILLQVTAVKIAMVTVPKEGFAETKDAEVIKMLNIIRYVLTCTIITKSLYMHAISP